MSGPRTVADMYGTGTPIEDAPLVTRTILDGGEDYAVDVDLTPTAAVMLEALADAIHNDPAASANHAWWALRYRVAPATRAAAVAELLASEAVRRALTIRLTPETADHLRDQLDEAAWEPGKCDATVYPATRIDPAENCARYVEDDARFCPQHSDPDDATEGYRL